MGQNLYQANINTVGTIIPETKIILNKYLELQSIDALKSELINNNLILKASKRRIENIFTEIKRRYLYEQETGYSENSFLYLLGHVKSDAIIELALYYHICKTEQIVFDFITSIVYERYFQGYLGITTEESFLYLEELAKENEDVRKWSERTFKDMKIALISILRDFKFMKGIRRPIFDRTFIPSIIFYYILYQNREQISNEYQLYECEDFKLIFMDKRELKVLLDEAFRNRFIDLTPSGDELEITYNYKNVKEIINGSSVKEKYDKLLEFLNNDELAWARHSGVPFIICSFDKHNCGSINKVISDLEIALKNFNVRVVNIEEVIFNILEQEELLEPAINAEKDDSFDVVENLKYILLNGIRNYLIKIALEIGPKGRILVTRLGSLPIYFRMISLISYLENKIEIPVVFFYPGSQNKNSLIMFDEYDDSTLRVLKV